MAGDILYFIHRNFRSLIGLCGLLALLAAAWLLTGAGVSAHGSLG